MLRVTGLLGLPLWAGSSLATDIGGSSLVDAVKHGDRTAVRALLDARTRDVIAGPEGTAALIAAAARLRFPLRTATYQTLIGLLAVAGMRVGEAIRLDRPDADLHAGVLTIRQSKFGKSRLIPLHPSTTGALTRYAALRDEHHPRPAAPALFLSTAGTRLLHSNVGTTFSKLTAQAGLARRSAACRPRIHDVRHSFAVATVLGWYRDGADVAAMMPRLSTYLGHTDPKHTYWYLSAAPELMALAGDRLHAHLNGES